MVVADAETGDDLELWEFLQRRLVAAHRVVGHCHAADSLGDLRREAVEVAAGLELVQHELVGKAVLDDGLVRPVNQKVDLLRMYRGSHQMSFPSALSCQRRNRRCESSASSI